MSLTHSLADRVPLQLRSSRVAASPRALIGLSAVAVSAVLFGLVLLWLARPESRATPLQRTSAAAGARTSSSSPTPSASGWVTVHVAGAVRRPGLVRVSTGSRVADAVTEAGGPTAQAELASVNLARPLVDGEQLVVLAIGSEPVSAAPAPGAPAAGSPVPGALVDLNTAGLAELDALPGVGPVLAQRILDWRTRNGSFRAVSELREVTGIGEAKFADLEPRVRI